MSGVRPAIRRWSRTLTARGRDHGALSLEMLIVFPAILLLILLVVHVGLWWHARNVAMTGAQLGAESARVRGASLSDGTSQARAFLARAGGSISNVHISGSRGQTVRIRVTGHVDTAIPGLTLPIDQTVDASIERVTEPG